MDRYKESDDPIFGEITQCSHWLRSLRKNGLNQIEADNLFEKNATFLGLFINYLPYPFYVIDAEDYTIKAANPAALFGRLTKKSTCYALTHNADVPCSSEKHPCPLKMIKKLKQPVTVEHFHSDQDGTQKNVEVHAFPIFDAKGKVTQIIEFVIDISDRKRAEERLRKSEERFRQISETAEEWIWEVNADGLYTYSNQVVERILGWKPSDIVGKKHVFDLVKPDKKGKMQKKILGALAGKDPFRRLTKFNIKKNGKVVILSSSGLPIFDDDHNLVGYRGVDTDITEQKRYEAALKVARIELERRVEERTEELRKAYDERVCIQNTFGTYVSHDIASEILKSPDGLKLQGEMREMSILVCDLRGFSTITESLKASEVVRIINSFHEKMIPIITKYEGTIDEFIGDGILVFFGAPRFFSDHSKRAVKCAIDMQKAIPDINNDNPRIGLPEIEMGIGISTGDLVVGSIGTEKRKKYGAIGSPINLAFRLEEKARPGEILISEKVKKKIGDTIVVSSQWDESLKGIGKTAIYSIIDLNEK